MNIRSRKIGTKKLHAIVFVLLIVLITFFSYKLVYAIGERYFYDKLFYRKSITYGYTEQNKDLTVFGKRAKDIILLRNITDKGAHVLGIQDDPHIFTIAIIGDSYVWGQGIKNENRFATLLEQKLNAIKRTKIYSFSLPGDNFIDHYEKIKIMQPLMHIDLYIYFLVFNDILMIKDTKYFPETSKEIKKECEKYGPFAYDYVENDWNQYIKNIVRALQTESNRCIARYFFQSLPQNTIVFEPDYIFDNDPQLHNMYLSFDGLQNFRRVSSYDYLYLFPGPVTNSEKFWNVWHVSNKEGHPSTVTNIFFTDALFKEITSNSDWKFINR